MDVVADDEDVDAMLVVVHVFALIDLNLRALLDKRLGDSTSTHI